MTDRGDSASLWRATCSLPTFPPLEGDLRTDVLIIGGGLAGLLTARFLRQAGVDCTLIEGDRICSGATGSTTAKITAQHGLIFHKLIRRFGAEKAGLYLRANEDAVERYRALCREMDCDFADEDSFVYSLGSPRKLEQEADALERLGHPAKLLSHIPLPFPTAGAVSFPWQARFHPLKFAAAIVQGLPIFEHTRALEWDGKGVVTSRGRVTADTVIVTTHFPLFNKHGGYFLKLYQSRSYVLSLKGTTPRCPHMGCALKWNPREKSWDCPCHGSRFDRDGRLLDNPANGDLPKKP